MSHSKKPNLASQRLFLKEVFLQDVAENCMYRLKTSEYTLTGKSWPQLCKVKQLTMDWWNIDRYMFVEVCFAIDSSCS